MLRLGAGIVETPPVERLEAEGVVEADFTANRKGFTLMSLNQISVPNL
jgi:hypothetical protein